MYQKMNDKQKCVTQQLTKTTDLQAPGLGDTQK